MLNNHHLNGIVGGTKEPPYSDTDSPSAIWWWMAFCRLHRRPVFDRGLVIPQPSSTGPTMSEKHRDRVTTETTGHPRISVNQSGSILRLANGLL